jgi:hypothetical protein
VDPNKQSPQRQRDAVGRGAANLSPVSARVALAASIGFAPVTLRDLRAPCTQRTCQQRLPLTLSLFTHTPTSDVGSGKMCQVRSSQVKSSHSKSVLFLPLWG